MEKISGIVPSSARVTSVDLQSTGAARPGMPAFGRPVGTSSLTDRRAVLDTAAKASFEHRDLMAGRAAPNATGASASPVPVGPAEAHVSNLPTFQAEALTHIQDPRDPPREFSVKDGADADIGAPISAKLVPRGSYVDVRA